MNQRAIANSWRVILLALGYDRDDPHLAETPRRVADFFAAWHTNGAPPPPLKTFPSRGYTQMVVSGALRFHAMCAHHGLPFFGVGVLGYLPGERQIVGLSKLARVLDHFSRRFTTQEDITRETADYLARALRPRGVGVVLRAEHLCMSMRGIQRPGHFTVTSDLRGSFRRSPATRAEFLAYLREDPK